MTMCCVVQGCWQSGGSVMMRVPGTVPGTLFVTSTSGGVGVGGPEGTYVTICDVVQGRVQSGGGLMMRLPGTVPGTLFVTSTSGGKLPGGVGDGGTEGT